MDKATKAVLLASGAAALLGFGAFAYFGSQPGVAIKGTPGIVTLHATVIWKSRKAMEDCHYEKQAIGKVGPICLEGVLGQAQEGAKARLLEANIDTNKVLVLEGPAAGVEGVVTAEKVILQ